MGMLLFRRCNLLDPGSGEYRPNSEILIEGERIREVSERAIRSESAAVVDVGGRTVMPGLIDAHIHVYLSEVNLHLLEDVPLTLMAGRAATLMRAMLDRGFTTVRDTGGADFGIREAVETGHLVGPRLFIAGQGISQTGGHGDFRSRTAGPQTCACCSGVSLISRIVDGVPEMLRAVRDELRKGADHIKLMVSGGVASPNDPLDSLQFTEAEIAAAVGEARAWKRYVCAHAYGADAIARAVACGVRSIEHGNLIDEPTARLMREKGAFIVPTLVAYDAMRRRGHEFGLPPVSQEKNKIVLEAGLRSLELCQAAGVPIGFGSDLLGQLQTDQSREFLIRAEAMSPLEIIRSATLVNARLLQREGELGVIAPGAFADLLVLDGDPLKDLGLLQDQGAHLRAIVKGGAFHKNRLAG
ncbi:MAG TPA: amidohydrolase family protein [Stellaceae bacterium]|nr:amidohydrolase family protein [Stellaceae bacterium]